MDIDSCEVLQLCLRQALFEDREKHFYRSSEILLMLYKATFVQARNIGVIAQTIRVGSLQISLKMHQRSWIQASMEGRAYKAKED